MFGLIEALLVAGIRVLRLAVSWPIRWAVSPRLRQLRREDIQDSLSTWATALWGEDHPRFQRRGQTGEPALDAARDEILVRSGPPGRCAFAAFKVSALSDGDFAEGRGGRRRPSSMQQRVETRVAGLCAKPPPGVSGS